MKLPSLITLVVGGGLLTWLFLTALIMPPPAALFIDGRYATLTLTDAAADELLTNLSRPDEVWLFGAHVNRNAQIDPVQPGNLIQQMRAREVKVILAVGVLTNYQGKPDYVDWATNATARTILAQSIADHVTTVGYDGVLLDFEPMTNGDPTYITFIQDLKTKLSVPIGVYGFKLVPTGGTAWQWTPDYAAQLGTEADFLMLGLYNAPTHIRAAGFHATPDGYARWVAYQKELMEAQHVTNVYYGFAAYEQTPFHDPAIENIRAAAPMLYRDKTVVFGAWAMTADDHEAYADFRRIQRQGGD